MSLKKRTIRRIHIILVLLNPKTQNYSFENIGNDN